MVASEVGGFDLELVLAVVEECGAPGVGEVEAVEAGFALAVLSRAGGVDASECGAWEQCLAEVDWGVPGRQRMRAGVTGRLSQGGGTLRAGIWCASAITSTDPKIEVGARTRPLRENTIFVTLGLVVSCQGLSAPGRSGSR